MLPIDPKSTANAAVQLAGKDKGWNRIFKVFFILIGTAFFGYIGYCIYRIEVGHHMTVFGVEHNKPKTDSQKTIVYIPVPPSPTTERPTRKVEQKQSPKSVMAGGDIKDSRVSAGDHNNLGDVKAKNVNYGIAEHVGDKVIQERTLLPDEEQYLPRLLSEVATKFNLDSCVAISILPGAQPKVIVSIEQVVKANGYRIASRGQKVTAEPFEGVEIRKSNISNCLEINIGPLK